MNRRSFLVRLGQAAVAAAVLEIDPERALWIPGQKTIIDMGATTQVVPATDAEVVSQATRSLASFATFEWANAEEFVQTQLRRDVRLDIMGDDDRLRSFRFHGDRLVGSYTPADMELLGRGFFKGRKA